MTTYFEYKDYQGTIELSIECGKLFGKIAFIQDRVTYNADTIPQLEKEFKISVDGYLDGCAELDKSPDIPCEPLTTEEIHLVIVQTQVKDLKIGLIIFVGGSVAYFTGLFGFLQ